MDDNFGSKVQGVSDVATGSKAITPADGVNLASARGQYPTAFYLNTAQAGAITYKDLYGNTITYTFDAGYHPVRVSEILATGTGATSVLLLWQTDPEAAAA